jgi:hypothetical protein
MRNALAGVILSLTGLVLFASAAAAQTGNTQPKQGNAARSPWKYYPTDRPVGDGGPAPKRDLTGTWAGPSSGAAVPRGTNMQTPTAPPLTALGKQLFEQNKPIGKYSPAGTNDPHTRYCDPFGFPHNMTDEIRGMTITMLPNRMFILLQYMDVWREIWMDGRALPKGVAEGKDGLDPRYNGYSVGHWEDDYTFVVDTTGLDDGTWATKNGYPHSIDALVHERFHRDSKYDLTLTMTMDDPKIYTKQFVIGEEHFRWIPNQQFDEFTCIPSQVQQYLKEMGDPAGFDLNAAPQRGQRGQQ